jgi:plasmid stabilization system protein ParE
MRYRLREADGVIDDLADHYQMIVAGGQPAAADALLVAYDQLTDRLCDFPGIGHVFETDHPRLQNVRVRGLPSPYFSFQVFYTVERDVVCVLAVIHASRGPEGRQRILGDRN